MKSLSRLLDLSAAFDAIDQISIGIQTLFSTGRVWFKVLFATLLFRIKYDT